MKKIVISVLTIIPLGLLIAQTRANDALDLFSRKINGTARYRALGGAMGALGEDISAISLNPAGGAVSVRSHGAMTLGVNYYKNEFDHFNNEKTRFNLTQIGGNFVFASPNANAKWKRFAFTLNYDRNNILDKEIEIPAFDDKYTYRDDYQYIKDEDQGIIDTKKGKFYYDGENLSANGYSDQFSFGFSGNYDHRVFLGIGFNFHDSHKELNQTIRRSLVKDNRNIDQSSYYDLDGTGFSLNLGVIGRITDELRLGISYQSPVWWNIKEYRLNAQNMEKDPLYSRRFDPDYAEDYDEYDFRTPSRLTGSVALVIGKKLAIDGEVIYRDYKNVHFSGYPYDYETNRRNEDILRNTLEYRIGSEYRLGQVSFRGGYRYAQDPYKDLEGSASIYSIGLGYNFGDIYFSGSYDYTDADTEYEIVGGRTYKTRDYANIKQNLTRSNFIFTIGYRF